LRECGSLAAHGVGIFDVRSAEAAEMGDEKAQRLVLEVVDDFVPSTQAVGKTVEQDNGLAAWRAAVFVFDVDVSGFCSGHGEASAIVQFVELGCGALRKVIDQGSRQEKVK
jgi:hypothetical protein